MRIYIRTPLFLEMGKEILELEITRAKRNILINQDINMILLSNHLLHWLSSTRDCLIDVLL